MSFDYCLVPEKNVGNVLCMDSVQLTDAEKAVFAELKILKIDISSTSNDWCITLDSRYSADGSLLNKIAASFCQSYNLSSVCFQTSDTEENWLLQAKNYMTKYIESDCPDIAHVLRMGEWTEHAETLYIPVESTFALARIKQKKVDKIFNDLLKIKFPKKVALEFIVSPISREPVADNMVTEEYLAALAVVEEENSGGKTIKNGVLFGRSFKGQVRPINSIQEEEPKVIVEGTIHRFDLREMRTGSCALKFDIFDTTDGLQAKIIFDSKEKYVQEAKWLKAGQYVRIMGRVQQDRFERNELVLTPKNIMLVEKIPRFDNASEKRVELHAHTKMSALDAVMSTKEYIQCATDWGHQAVAITDHGVVQAFPEAYETAKQLKREKGVDIKIIYGMEGYLVEHEEDKEAWHIIILAASQKGLQNLYRLVSFSHLKYFYKRPRIPRKLLEEYREGLILGSACEAGELYQAVLNSEHPEKIRDIASFYDYLEVQPNGNNAFLLRTGRVADEETLCAINKKIIALGQELGKRVVATCDVHFLKPEDDVYRRILQGGQGYSDADQQPPIYFRTTAEMFEEFKYLDQETAHEIIVKNPVEIAASIASLQPIPDELYSPQIPGAADEVSNMSYCTAKKLYGDILPQIVSERLDMELKCITGNGFSELYLIAHKLVKKSLDDGYIVGSRGSVGSSLVATMMNITEVNPLPPHYRCIQCNYSEFIEDGSVGSGFDLPEKACPHCQSKMTRDGQNIPFAVFLGFKGDKVPDIDLNFSGEYQAKAHKYTEELFGRANVFRAGTISTIAEKTAGGFARKYYEEKGMSVRSAHVNGVAVGCEGVKRTTGQHPGGIMVVPRDMDVHFFTPLQRPADDRDSNTVTTHFDYHSINDRLVKLDILGHDDPTVIKLLEELTGVKIKDIPFNDPATMSLFRSTEALGVLPAALGSNVGTFGIPEFGTRFVRQMLEDTNPACFSDLVRISGYSHGENVWLDNAQDLIKNNIAKVEETISSRDDIMIYLMKQGVEALTAFNTMEDVRKNKFNINEEKRKKEGKKTFEETMRENNVPEWYIESCKKIKYMFPKAHATAYVMMAYRIAWCKVHYPKEFYAAYFSIRADDFDADLILEGAESIKNHLKSIEQKGREASAKEKSLATVLELAYEMNLRGLEFHRVDIYQSHPKRFLIKEGALLPPLTALAGLGQNAALNIATARKEGEFISRDDLRVRAGISKTIIELLGKHGCLDGLPESNQVCLF